MVMTVDLPETVGVPEARFLLALKLYETGRVSSGKAAEMADLSKATFLELAGKAGVSALAYPIAELAEDLRNA